MKLFVYCAGGLGKEVFDIAKRVIQAEATWECLNFIDDNPALGKSFYGANVFTFNEFLEKFDLNEVEVVIANGEPAIRKIIYDKVKARGVKLGKVIDPSAIIADTAKLGEGVIITSYCSVVSDAELGANVVLNCKAIIGHDIKVGAHTVISSMVNVGGACVIGESSYVGMGTQIKEGITIGSEAIVGMGSVVYNDVPDEMIAIGNPARPLRKNVDKRVFKKN
ncbi:acetyltransferase [Pseudoduganella ginsengisoli]|uniref:Sugar acetyltransferase n=1 Tax=Pseudoduganella ginsengisoli TaxID=1462440 RepID=A0A6L6PSR7_9BURK|nr:acetyltransferase [Pseudoduganella ginsengisoli]MTW00505.1 sugar acetyltransferase [Pseudoduganella ginsengisoli]